MLGAFCKIKQGDLSRSLLFRVSHIFPVSLWMVCGLVIIDRGSFSNSTDPTGLLIVS